MDTTTGIIIGVIVLVVVVAAVFAFRAASKKKQEKRRVEAERLREGATGREDQIAAREAEAHEAAKAAEAARREAQRLEQGAEQLNADAATHRQKQQRDLTEADRLDPDVDRKSEGYVEPGRPETTEHRTTENPDSTQHRTT